MPAPVARPHVLIIGGGFGGLKAAQCLARANVRITLLDRRNHHLFQPLLYQVATGGLSPAHIAAPIRSVLSRQRNVEVVLGEATAIDIERRVVKATSGDTPYDYLILATGATHSYFGHDAWASAAPGLKTIDDALEIRRRFLLAFEAAEIEPDPARRSALMTFVVIGGGPTGVEMAGAIAEIARTVMRRDFRRIDTREARVVLVEGQDRVLASGFPPELSARAKRDLTHMGVEVRVGVRATNVTGGASPGVMIGHEQVAAHNIIWAAGVRASPLAATLGAPTDSDGRVVVNRDLTIPGHPEVFVIGDLARCVDSRSGDQVPGVCPAAVQMGAFVASLIARESSLPPNGATPAREPFKYRDKGLLATIGRARAVAAIGSWKFGGMTAWLLWAGVHIFFLIGFRNRLLVMLEWAWAYAFFKRGARLITAGSETAGSNPSQPTVRS